MAGTAGSSTSAGRSLIMTISVRRPWLVLLVCGDVDVHGRTLTTAYSDGSRSPIPIDADDPIRWKPIALNDRSRSRFPIEGDRLTVS